MIPRAPPTASPYHQPAPPSTNKSNNSMLDKLKLFKNNDRPISVTTTNTTTGKRTSSSSGVSSAKSERSDSSVSLDVKPIISRSSGGRTAKPQKGLVVGNGGLKMQGKGSPNSGKKEVVANGGSGVLAKTALEKHAHKVASLGTPTPVMNKMPEVKIKTPIIGNNHKTVSSFKPLSSNL